MAKKQLSKNGLSFAIRVAILASMGLLPSIAFSEGLTEAKPQAVATTAQSTSKNKTTIKKPATLETVQVTGTHIRRVDLATQQPISSITHEEIVKQGLTTVGQVLNQMTTIGISNLNTQSVQSPDDIEQGGAFANLRYLGSNRVLVLVNGKRWVANPNGSVDLSTIPASVIKRVVVLKDGASAIYGSDAITGVVNIITRKRFNGLELDVGYGTNEQGDGTTPHANIMFGSTTNRSSFLMDLSWSKRSAMWLRSRNITKYGKGGPYHPSSSFYNVSPRGQFTDSSGTFLLNKLGDDTTNLANYTQINPQDYPLDATYNQYAQAQFRQPLSQASLYTNMHYDFNDHLTLTTTAMFTSRRSVSEIGPYPLTRGIFRNFSGLISKDSIYNPTNEDVAFGVILPNAPRITTHLVRSMHVSSGLEGDFSIGDSHDWHWDAYINFNKQDGETTMHNQVNLLYLQRGIGPSFIDENGVPTCGTPSDPIVNQKQTPCTPINILAGIDGVTPDIRKHLIFSPTYTFAFADKGAAADITGGLFEIPFGGQVAIAAGASVRKVTGFQHEGLFKQLALTTSAAAGDTNGEFVVRSAYGELSIPLLKNLPGVKLLDFDIATRYSNYSNFGSTTNSKLGIQYRPIADLLLRGTYSEAYRAPTIADFAGGVTEGFGGFVDPCDAEFGLNAFGQQVHSACLSQLTKLIGSAKASKFRQLSHLGSPTTFPGQENNTLADFGPSSGLGPETAKTYTYGFVYSPHQLPGLTVGVNWWKIRLRNVITGISGDFVMRECYLGVQSDCAAFSRNPVSGQVDSLIVGLRNIGLENVSGEDFDFRYRFPVYSIGQFTVDTHLSYYNNLETQQREDAPLEQSIGWSPFWRIKSVSSLRWSRGSLSASWRIRYFSSLRESCAFGTESECNMPDHIDPFRGYSPTNRIGSIAYNDASVTWTNRGFGTVTLGVSNIFKRQPPVMYSGSVEATTLSAYPVDRFWYVNYDKKF